MERKTGTEKQIETESERNVLDYYVIFLIKKQGLHPESPPGPQLYQPASSIFASSCLSCLVSCSPLQSQVSYLLGNKLLVGFLCSTLLKVRLWQLLILDHLHKDVCIVNGNRRVSLQSKWQTHTLTSHYKSVKESHPLRWTTYVGVT